MSELVYKVVSRDDWDVAQRDGVYRGAPIDVTDGFIHLSAANQLVETVARHFSGQHNLLLVAIEAKQLGDALRWEPSRGGKLFPHLYGELPLTAVLSAVELPLGEDHQHVLPATLNVCGDTR